MKSKKILVAALLVAVLTAGVAYAGGRKKQGGHGGRMWGAAGGGMCESCGERFGGPYGGRRRGGINTPEIPQEIRDKLTEAQKIAIDLRAELEKNPIDREKALEFHAKRSALMQEISDWYFNRRLDALTSR